MGKTELSSNMPDALLEYKKSQIITSELPWIILKKNLIFDTDKIKVRQSATSLRKFRWPLRGWTECLSAPIMVEKRVLWKLRHIPVNPMPSLWIVWELHPSLAGTLPPTVMGVLVPRSNGLHPLTGHLPTSQLSLARRKGRHGWGHKSYIASERFTRHRSYLGLAFFPRQSWWGTNIPFCLGAWLCNAEVFYWQPPGADRVSALPTLFLYPHPPSHEMWYAVPQEGTTVNFSFLSSSNNPPQTLAKSILVKKAHSTIKKKSQKNYS